MLRAVYSVYDAKAKVFLAPFTCPNAGVAGRWFASLVRDDSHDFGKFPEDYTLFELGVFDDEKGSFDNLSAPTAVVGAISLKGVERAS